MSKLIVIVGVTGTQGSSVANKFLQSPNEWKIRGISRNPSSPASQALIARGVEIVKGDIDDVSTLVSAFEGAHAIYSNTDFFLHFIGALSDPSLVPGTHAYEREVEQGVKIASAANSPAVLKTLEKFIYSSLSDATRLSKGKYKDVHHFDSKAETERQIKKQFPEVAKRMSTLQMGNYAENWKGFPGAEPLKQEDGSYFLVRPFSPSVVLDFVAAQADAGAFVKALVDAEPGKELLGVSEAMTAPEFMAIWGRIHGVKAGYKQITPEEYFKNIPAVLGEELLGSDMYIEDFGHDGGDPNVLRPKQLDPNIKLTTMEEYIKNEDWSKVFGEK